MDPQVSTIITIGIGVPIFILIVLKIFNIFSKNSWFCKNFGWHKTPKAISSDGCNKKGICPRCGKYVMQDSQGNWF